MNRLVRLTCNLFNPGPRPCRFIFLKKKKERLSLTRHTLLKIMAWSSIKSNQNLVWNPLTFQKTLNNAILIFYMKNDFFFMVKPPRLFPGPCFELDLIATKNTSKKLDARTKTHVLAHINGMARAKGMYCFSK